MAALRAAREECEAYWAANPEPYDIRDYTIWEDPDGTTRAVKYNVRQTPDYYDYDAEEAEMYGINPYPWLEEYAV